MVVIAVSDTGAGMTQEELRHAFEEFYKADQSRHERRSPGLGLSICKRIVESHGGRIWLESDGPAKGTTAHVALPTPRNDNATRKWPPAAAPATGPQDYDAGCDDECRRDDR